MPIRLKLIILAAIASPCFVVPLFVAINDRIMLAMINADPAYAINVKRAYAAVGITVCEFIRPSLIDIAFNIVKMSTNKLQAYPDIAKIKDSVANLSPLLVACGGVSIYPHREQYLALSLFCAIHLVHCLIGLPSFYSMYIS